MSDTEWRLLWKQSFVFPVAALTSKGPSDVEHLRIEHDFAEQHVFEGCDGSGAVDGVVALEGLVEVGVSRLPVFLLRCMNDPWKHVSTHKCQAGNAAQTRILICFLLLRRVPDCMSKAACSLGGQ